MVRVSKIKLKNDLLTYSALYGSLGNVEVQLWPYVYEGHGRVLCLATRFIVYLCMSRSS